jgi:hypothetical protein
MTPRSFTAEVVVGEPLTYETTMGGQLTPRA